MMTLTAWLEPDRNTNAGHSLVAARITAYTDNLRPSFNMSRAEYFTQVSSAVYWYPVLLAFP